MTTLRLQPTHQARRPSLVSLGAALLGCAAWCSGVPVFAQGNPGAAAPASAPAPASTPAPASAPAPAPARVVIPAPPPAGAPTAAPTGAPAPASTTLKPEQLEALVAPLALYPDPLLSQVLVASTYPLEIMQAQQWAAKNPNLKGDALLEAAQKQPWDPSVQSLVVFPDAMKRMSENISWTTALGDAFLAQQGEVMDAVQRLRRKAKESGKLATSEQQVVTTKVVEKETIVVIEPAKTEVVYVPVYDPSLVWGPHYYPYPAVYYPPPPPMGAMFVTFGVGMMVGAAVSGGWGYGCGWGHSHSNVVVVNHHNTVVRNNNSINHNGNGNRGNSNWQHNPSHRGNVPYKDSRVSEKFGQTNGPRQSGFAPGPRNDALDKRGPQAGTSDGRGFGNDGRGGFGNDGRGGFGNDGRDFDHGGRDSLSGSDRDGRGDRGSRGPDRFDGPSREGRSREPRGSRGSGFNGAGSRGGGRGGRR